VDRSLLARAFNEWLRRFTENPEQFEHEWETVHKFLEERNNGEEPSYGDECAEYLLSIIADLEK
jgi:hypothetical protein